MPPPGRSLGDRLLATGPRVSLSLDHAALAARLLLQHHMLHLGGVGGRHTAVCHLKGAVAATVGLGHCRGCAAAVGLDRRAGHHGRPHRRRCRVRVVERADRGRRRRRDRLAALDHLDDLVRLPTQVTVWTKRVVPTAVRAAKRKIISSKFGF